MQVASSSAGVSVALLGAGSQTTSKPQIILNPSALEALETLKTIEILETLEGPEALKTLETRSHKSSQTLSPQT